MSKSFKIAIVLSILVSFYFIFSNSSRSRSRIVFCDVGQGDAIYLRLPEKQDILIDAGPYSQVVNCLNQQMPYFDRTIEMFFLSHAQKDHYGGLKYLLSNYKIERFFVPYVLKYQDLKSAPWIEIKQLLKQNKLPLEGLERNDKIVLNSSEFLVLSPFRTPGVRKEIIDDLNNSGLGILATVNNQHILLLGDLDAPFAERAIQGLNSVIDILKINHHGSKYGLSSEFLELAEPTLGVLSVGKNNWYGHPHPETINLLKAKNIPLRRTDKEGSIEIPLNE